MHAGGQHPWELSLSEQQQRDFERDGFVGPLPRFLPIDEIDALRRELDDLVSNNRSHPLYGRFSVRDWHLASPLAMRLFTHPAIVRRLQQLAGEDLLLWRSKVIHQAPGDGEGGWHQEWGWFNGEEIGNDRPALIPTSVGGDWWNLTVWVALDDITPDTGPLRFVRGSQKTRYPIRMVPMVDSAFFQDPFIGEPDVATLVERARENRLVLDTDTSRMFDGIDAQLLSRDALKTYVRNWLASLQAANPLPFDVPAESLATLTMKKGDFVIFSERTLHALLPNGTASDRIAINCRVTTSDTLVYPGRLRGDFIDGTNLDISRHRCVLLSGRKLNRANACLHDEAGALLAGLAPRAHGLLGERLLDRADAPGLHCWENRLDARTVPLLGGARVLGSVLIPGVTYVEMALAAAGEVLGRRPVSVEQVEYHHALVLQEDAARRIQLSLQREGEGAAVRVHSRPAEGAGPWQLHASLRLRLEAAALPEPGSSAVRTGRRSAG
ncbi:phytanoyl-CoA dioxygenase family protein [Corallococcus sicarius]|uniref:phytanoyl-CoA dioxygenase family protein n=1 Tax=Corallococcus sicarius TaxID=2316726 RepID=UPI0013150C4D|nr:phytanoyl-CoA dioxygenase family protein [Corallococcus sicarius]